MAESELLAGSFRLLDRARDVLAVIVP